MGFNIRFAEKPQTGSCAFKAPFIYNYYGAIPVGTATTVASPFAPLAANPLTGVLGTTHFATDGCDDLILRVAHYDNGDNQACDTCPPPSTSTPTVVNSYIYIPKGSSMDIPGYIVDYSFVHVPSAEWTGDAESDYALAGTTNADGAVIGVTSDTTILYVASCREINPCCLLPDVTVGAVTVPGDVPYIEGKPPVAGEEPPVFPTKGREAKKG